MSYYIGTSGWSYEHWFNGVFYPQEMPKSKAFGFYQTQFKTVELNVTYYRLLPKTTFEGWHKKSAENFIYAVKGSRFITLNKKLSGIEEPLEKFFERVSGLQKKAGPVLWQFPPSFGLNIERLRHFIELLPKEYRHSFEFRHKTWFVDDVYLLLKKHNMALVIADSPKWLKVEKITADFRYTRFHSGKILYGSNYSDEELEQWAEKLSAWHSQSMDIYAYFNNDFNAYAPKNAIRLKRLLGD